MTLIKVNSIIHSLIMGGCLSFSSRVVIRLEVDSKAKKCSSHGDELYLFYQTLYIA